MGAWELELPLGNAVRGLIPLDNYEKQHFLVVQITEAQDDNLALALLL